MDANSNNITSSSIIPSDKTSKLCHIMCNTESVCSTTENDTPSLQDFILNVRQQYASQWEALALFLGLEDYQIDYISKDNAHNPNRSIDCCTAVFHIWRKGTSSPTWGMLEDAINKIQTRMQYSKISDTTGKHT